MKTPYNNMNYLFRNSFWGWFKAPHKQGFGFFTLQSSEMAQSQTGLQDQYRIFQESQTSCNEHIVDTNLCWSGLWGVKYDQHAGSSIAGYPSALNGNLFSLLFTGILLMYWHEWKPPLTECSTPPVQPTYSNTEENQYDCLNLFCKCTNSTLLSAFSLPEPVLPTMPIFSLGLMVKDTFFSTRGRFSRYRISAFSNTTSPSCGQSRGGVLFLIRAGASRESVL